MKFRLLFAFLFTTLPAMAEITWEVENRFPLLHEKAFQRIAQHIGSDTTNVEARITRLALRTEVMHLAPATPSRWNADTEQYSPELLSDRVKLLAKSQLSGTDCTWLLQEDGGAPQVWPDQDCARSPPLSATLNKRHQISVTRLGDGAHDRTTAPVRPTSYLVVALGDSFASGEGNPDYPADLSRSIAAPRYDWVFTPDDASKRLRLQPAQWLDTACHRSLLSWPALYSLREALSRKDTVVQFASFACSGAQVLDGFLLPQRNPPGHMRFSLTSKAPTYLLKSQQKAMADLLCPAGTVKPEKAVVSSTLRGLYLKEYGLKDDAVLERYGCQNPRLPDEVLVLFGGNDVKFSGVVKWVFHPLLAGKWQELWSTVQEELTKEMKPVSPAEAAPFIEALPATYALLNEGLSPFVKEAGQVVRMMQYPDPDLSEYAGAERETELKACKLRTRDANRVIQKMISDELGKKIWFARHDGAWYGISQQNLLSLRASFVDPLRVKQAKAASDHLWRLEDSLEAFRGRGICAGSLTCDSGDCPTPDKVRWNWSVGDVQHPKSGSWAFIGDFDGYDLSRARGLRYGYDALLIGARLDETGSRVLFDWVTNMAHPTAAVHAHIARMMMSIRPAAQIRPTEPGQ